MQTRITLCLIAKNEEHMLPECLESVRGAVDEMVVVDTGSTDRTRDIALAAGAKVIEVPWEDDFAAPRNAALAEVRSGFILQLDADERLVEGGAQKLRNAVKRKDFDLGMLRFHDAASVDASHADIISGKARLAAPYLGPRLLRHSSDLRYEGAIHEHVTRWLIRHGDRRMAIDVDIVHLGAATSVVTSRAKHERNFRLLHKRCAAETDDPTAWGYLVWEYIKTGDFDTGRRVADTAWEMLPKLSNAAYKPSILNLAVARINLQNRAVDGVGMMATAEAAMGHEGRHPDLMFLHGQGAELEANRSTDGNRRRELFQQAKRDYGSYLDAKSRLTYALNFIPNGERFVGHTRLGTVHLMLSEYREAIAAFKQALSNAPSHMEALLGLLEAHALSGDGGSVLNELQPLLSEVPDAWVIGAQAAIALDSPDDARLFCQQAVQLAQAKKFIGMHRVGTLEALRRTLG
jgi:tetratricopeptide (TPR) repeat protein